MLFSKNLFRQQILRRGSNTSLGSHSQWHQVIASHHIGRPQGTVKVITNEVPDNHPERNWGIAELLAVSLLVVIRYVFTPLVKQLDTWYGGQHSTCPSFGRLVAKDHGWAQRVQALHYQVGNVWP